MKYKIIKLDKRYSGHTFYQFMIEPFTRDTIEGPLQFIEVRNWCWATYDLAQNLGGLIRAHCGHGTPNTSISAYTLNPMRN